MSATLLCAAGLSLSAQDTASTPPPKGMVTYAGCVAASETRKNTYTMADGEIGPVYVLKGKNFRDLVGKRVEVTAKAPKKLAIKGGLYPNPNTAAQAGAISGGQAAVEAAQAGPYRNDFRPTVNLDVKSARIVTGDCPAR
ncbi:MAG: hypothetical protein LBQ09_08855 [Acidobacteriaceae bacterium]|nr:hypothetical protein [Acidobacteriaceae bacterium]